MSNNVPPPSTPPEADPAHDSRLTPHAYSSALAYLLAPTDPAKPVVARPDAAQNLPRMRRLLDALGAPDARFNSVVVAGTKGKGSVAAILAALCRAAGLRVGLYSQPHLHDYRERVRINGIPITADDLVAAVARLRPAVARLAATPELGQPSTYDLGTALALDHFAAAGVDLAILEIGLGGRYDSVNTITPLVSVITAISLDHIAVLGNTIAQIASEKAGIIKPGVPVIVAPQDPAAYAVIARIAADQRAPLHPASSLITVAPTPQQPDPLTGEQALDITLTPAGLRHAPALDQHFQPRLPAPPPPRLLPPEWRQSAAGQRQSAAGPGGQGSGSTPSYPLPPSSLIPHPFSLVPPPFRLPLLGSFQHANVATALAAALLLAESGHLPLDRRSIARGLADTRWPGRLEIARRHPLTIVDGAHNADSAARLRDALAALFPGRPLTLILGTSLDKDLPGIAAALVPAAHHLILTSSIHPRSAPLALLHTATDPYHIPTDDTPDLPAALDLAARRTPPNGLICATGSLFVVADAREHLGLATIPLII